MRSTALAALVIVVLSVLPGQLPAAAGITLLTEDTPPVNYLDKNQQPAGIAVEIVQEMARRVGDPGKIQVVPWARGYKDVQERGNTALFSTAWSPERDQLFKWVGPILTKEVVLYKKRGSKLLLSTLADTKKVNRIGTYKDDSKEQYLRKEGFINLDSALDDSANPKKLMAGRIDLWVSTSIQAGPTCRLAGVNPQDIEPTLTLKKQLMYLAFSKATADAVVAKWQQAFASMEQDGTVKKIQAKYGLTVSTGQMTIYTEDTPPQSFRQDGQITGSASEIVRQMLRRAGDAPGPIQQVTWVRGYNEIEKKANIALYPMARTRERENLFRWVGPIARTRVVFFARKGSGITINSLADAKKVGAIGTYKNDFTEQFLKGQGFTNIDSVSNNQLNPKKLLHNRIDLWISGAKRGPLLAQEAGLDPADLEEVFTVKVDNLYIALSKQTNFSVVKQWQDAIAAMHQDGSFARIIRRWNATW